MRIEQLLFERYGHFTDRTLAFAPDAALHVVLGANEAGKTSALSGIGDLLFGFGGRTAYDFQHDSKTLRIGGSFRHSDGRLIAARRRKGNKNTLIDAADQPLPDDVFAPLLNGVSRETFGREFGLTAEDLRQGGAELLGAGGRLSETLAASSAGMTALSKIKDRLKDEADELFTPRRSGAKPFYLAADRRDAADRSLRDAIVTREALAELQSAVEDSKQQLLALNAEHARSGGQLALWQRTLRARSKLARLAALQAELAELGDLPPLAPQALADWRRALDTHVSLGREIAVLDAADAADAEAMAALALDEALLDKGSAIDGLRERLGAVRKAVDDLPRRRQARDAAEATLTEAARRLGLPSWRAVLDKLPTDPALAQARDLIDRLKRAEQALAEAQARRRRAEQERDDFAAEEADARPLADPEQLRQRFEALGDLPAQLDRQRRDSAALTIETETLAAAVAALDPSPGALNRLRALPLPDLTVIGKHARAAELGEVEVKRLSDALAVIDATIATIESELARLSRAGAVPSRADLIEARRQRDARIDALRAVLQGEPPLRESRLAELTQASQAIDALTDVLLADTERAALHEDAQQRLAAKRDERSRGAATLAGLQQRLDEVTAEWTRTWAASGLAPRSPAEMLRWRERIDDILVRLGKLDGRKAEIAALDSMLEAGRSAVSAFLVSVGRVPDAALPLDHLYREAKSRFDELQAAWSDAKARAVAKRRIERDIAEAAAAGEAAAEALAALRQAWPAAMAGICRPDDATPAEAEAALVVWQSVTVPKAAHESEGHRVATIEADLIAFDRDVVAIADQVAPQLKREIAQDTLAALSARLTEMRNAAESCRRLRAATAQRAASRNTLAAQRASLAAVLADARDVLSVSDIAALAQPLDRALLRQQLETERAALQGDLLEIADGRGEAALRQEQEGLDLDLLPGEIARETLRQQQLLADIAAASALHHQKQSELDTLLKGRDAAGAAAERAEAGAELLSVAQRWLLRAAASRLATRAIERYRAMVQDPLLARASVLFATATGEAFAGLGIDYDDDDQPLLVARRSDGERVRVAGLSEGTRDQLFLALRLALLERRTAEPMPFIGDDLLTSFDDARTLATLRLLAAAGRQRQIILFTHHRHVAELARSLQDAVVDLIDL